jgi:HSP20 family molecular chaperone IbpA
MSSIMHRDPKTEIAGIDPEKDLEVSVGAGYLSIRAARSSHVEGKHRSEFRYGAFGRTLQLPPGADPDDVTADYTHGILTIKVAVKGKRPETVKTIPVAVGKK